MEQELKKWLVNDYFTPNIKAEVILDTLLTPYVAEIVEDGLIKAGKPPCGTVVFLTKEMSIADPKKNNGNMGSKVDYVLTDESAVYLVELKTTESSKGDEQKALYESLLGEYFGETLGEQLLSILSDTFKLQKDQKHQIDEVEGDEKLRSAWRLIWNKCALFKPKADLPKLAIAEAESNADLARLLIKNKGWAWMDSRYHSRKYLYTLGQLIDYIGDEEDKRGTLWDKRLRPVYLQPESDQTESTIESIRLRDAVREGGCLSGKADDPLATCLVDALKAIFEDSAWRKQKFGGDRPWLN